MIKKLALTVCEVSCSKRAQMYVSIFDEWLKN